MYYLSGHGWKPISYQYFSFSSLYFVRCNIAIAQSKVMQGCRDAVDDFTNMQYNIFCVNIPDSVLKKLVSLELTLFLLLTTSTVTVYLVRGFNSVMWNTPASVLDWLYTTVLFPSLTVTE